MFTTDQGKLGEWEDTDFTSRPEWFYELGLDQNSIIADPLLVDLDGADDVLGFVDGGLTASYYDNQNLLGPPVLTRFEPMIDVDWAFEMPAPGVPEDSFSVRWDGFVFVPVAGDYSFYSQANDGERLFLDGSPVIDNWMPDDGVEQSYLATGLTAGWHAIAYEVYDESGLAAASLRWSSPTTAKRPIPSRFFSTDPLTLIPGNYGEDDDLQVQMDSLTVDAGDPQSGYIDEPEPNGRRVNLGHTGNRTSAEFSELQVLQVLSPNGLEKFELDQSVAIQWHSAELPATTSYRDTVLSDAPLSYYRLDEISGTVANDLSGNDLHGTYTNGPTLDQLGAIADLSNRAVRLNGVDEHVELPTGFADFSAGLTLEVWVYPTSRSGSQPFIQLSNGPLQDSLVLGRSNSNSLQFLGVEVQDVVEPNRWQHFVGVLDADENVTVYKNGDLIGTGIASIPNDIPRTQNYLGRSAVGTDPMFNGLVDEAAIYDHPLSATQVKSHYDAGVIAGVIDVDLVHFSDGSVVQNIIDDTPNDGSFTWVIPANVLPGNDYAIRVEFNSGTSPEDRSNAAFSIASNGLDYYVNDLTTDDDVFTTAAGDNSHDGKSAATPMRSLHGLLNAYDLTLNDVVHVDTGAYRIYRELVLDELDGGVRIEGPSSTSALLQRGNQNSARYVFQLTGADDVVLDSLGIAGAYDGIHADFGADSQQFKISNSELFGHYQHGVTIDSSSLEPTLTDNRIHDVGSTGIDSQADNSLIDGNTVWNSGTAISSSAANSVISHNTVFGNNTGITATNFGVFATQVTDNIAHDNSNGIVAAVNTVVRGNSTYGNLSAGIVVSGSAVADSNEVWDNLDGIVGSQPNGCDSTITNNNVYHNRGRGIVVIGSGVAHDNVVYDNSIGIVGQVCNASGFVGQISNNLIYDNRDQGIVVATGSLGATVTNNTVSQQVGDAIRIQDNSSNVSLRNNILTTTTGFDIAVTPDSELGFHSDYNNLYVTGTGKVGRWENVEYSTRADWSSALNVDQHSLSADPQFSDPDGADNILGFSEDPIGTPTIVDNDDVEFASSGPWTLLPNGFGGDAVEIIAGAGESFATWTFSGLTSGATYQVAATWIPEIDLAQCEYQILDGERVDALEHVNQFADPMSFNYAGAPWQTLAFTRVTGTSLVVRLDNRAAANSRIRADAVRIQRVQGDRGTDDDFHIPSDSPSIDAGDPRDYYLSEPQPNGERVNQGADGNRPQAATSLQRVQVLEPNGFEKFDVGQTTTITWRESGIRSEQFVALINSGGPTVDNWLYDSYDHSLGSIPTELSDSVDLGAVINPAPPAVYESLISSSTGAGNQLLYELPVPDGNYTIRLHFVEPSETAPGVRMFDILAQGTLVLDNYDIVDDAGGPLRAVTRTFMTTVVSGNGLEIELINETDEPAVLAAIEVTTTNPGGLPAATVNLELSTDLGTTWNPLANDLGMDRFGRGSFVWTAAPATTGNTALVRVTANEGARRPMIPMTPSRSTK